MGWLVVGSRASGFEVFGGAVIVRLRHRAVIAQAHLLGGISGRQIGTDTVAVAAVESASFALEQRACTGRRKFGRGGFDLHRGTNAVTTDADGHCASKHAHAGDAAGVDIGQRWVHVVAAGREQIHAIDLNAQTVIGHAVQAGQARDTARALHAKARQRAQQTGAVTAGAARGLDGFCINAAGAQSQGGFFRPDGDGLQGVIDIALRDGNKRQSHDESAQRAQRRRARTGADREIRHIELTKRGGRAQAQSAARAIAPALCKKGDKEAAPSQNGAPTLRPAAGLGRAGAGWRVAAPAPGRW